MRHSKVGHVHQNTARLLVKLRQAWFSPPRYARNGVIADVARSEVYTRTSVLGDIKEHRRIYLVPLAEYANEMGLESETE